MYPVGGLEVLYVGYKLQFSFYFILLIESSSACMIIIIVLRWHNKHISPFSVNLNEFNVLAYHVSIIFTCCDGGMLNMVVGVDNEYTMEEFYRT